MAGLLREYLNNMEIVAGLLDKCINNNENSSWIPE
jgi:hypothetical protein